MTMTMTTTMMAKAHSIGAPELHQKLLKYLSELTSSLYHYSPGLLPLLFSANLVANQISKVLSKYAVDVSGTWLFETKFETTSMLRALWVTL